MNRLQDETLHRMLDSSCTANIVDRQKQLAAFYYSRAKGIEPECKQLFLNSRLSWLNWQTRTQRQWQKHTRNTNKAIHHDSISLREGYVRCNS